MKPLVLLAAALSMTLAGCQQKDETPAARFGAAGHKGRYFGLGLYGAGRMWAQLDRPTDPKGPVNPAAATLKDDEIVLVVLDSATGEIRQCGNLSGYCVRSDPWALQAGAAPAALAKHAEQLDAEAPRQSRSRRPTRTAPFPTGAELDSLRVQNLASRLLDGGGVGVVVWLPRRRRTHGSAPTCALRRTTLPAPPSLPFVHRGRRGAKFRSAG